MSYILEFSRTALEDIERHKKSGKVDSYPCLRSLVPTNDGTVSTSPQILKRIQDDFGQRALLNHRHIQFVFLLKIIRDSG